MSSQSRANSQPKQVLCPNCELRTAWFSDANIDTAENLGATQLIFSYPVPPRPSGVALSVRQMTPWPSPRTQPPSKPPQLPFQSFRLETMAKRKGQQYATIQSQFEKFLPFLSTSRCEHNMKLDDAAEAMTAKGRLWKKKTQKSLTVQSFGPISLSRENQQTTVCPLSLTFWICVVLKNATKLENIKYLSCSESLWVSRRWHG